RSARFRHLDRDLLAGADQMRAAGGRGPHPDVSLLDEFLDPRAREIGAGRGEENVEPCPRRGGSDLEPPDAVAGAPRADEIGERFPVVLLHRGAQGNTTAGAVGSSIPTRIGGKAEVRGEAYASARLRRERKKSIPAAMAAASNPMNCDVERTP